MHLGQGYEVLLSGECDSLLAGRYFGQKLFGLLIVLRGSHHVCIPFYNNTTGLTAISALPGSRKAHGLPLRVWSSVLERLDRRDTNSCVAVIHSCTRLRRVVRSTKFPATTRMVKTDRTISSWSVT